MSLEDLLDGPHELNRIERREEDGRELIYLELTHSKARLELWFDPSVKYLVRKSISHFRGGWTDTPAHRKTATRFEEIVPGIYFPAEVIAEDVNSELDSHVLTYSFEDLQVNHAIPANVFKMEFPPNTLVRNLIEHTTYRVDAQGSLHEETNRQMVDVPPVPLENRPSVTREEPQPGSRWILRVSALIFMVGVGAWVIRLYRRVKVRTVEDRGTP